MSLSLDVDSALLAGAALLVLGVICARLADRVRVPGLLLFLGLGMAIGDDGLGLISLDDAGLAQSISVAALVVILYEGGLSSSARELRQVAAPALALATVGVVVTAGVVAAAALGVFADVEPTTALLIGAVVASTDAAAVFAVLRRSPLPRRLRLLLGAESGANDPMAVLLTVGLLETWAGDVTAADWFVFGVRQLGGGAAVGLAVGLAGAAVLHRLDLGSTALVSVFGLGPAGVAYGGGAAMSTSGFLAAYVAGVTVAARSPEHRRAIRSFHDGLATSAQIVLFGLLGLLVFPSQLGDVALQAVAVTAVLVLVARPLAVLVCTMWFPFRWSEWALGSWAGLRGAVPIVLATFPLTVGSPDGGLIFNVVFFVVLTSAALQGVTVGPLARRLGLATDPAAWASVAEAVPLDAGGVEVVEGGVGRTSPVADAVIRDVPLPLEARIAAVVRSGQVRVPTGTTQLLAGDRLVVVAAGQRGLPEAIEAWAAGPTTVEEPGTAPP